MKYYIFLNLYLNDQKTERSCCEVIPGENMQFILGSGLCLGKLVWTKQEEGSWGGCLDLVFQKDAPACVSAGLEAEEAHWEKDHYCFAPAAVYNGNRFASIPLAYPPYYRIPKEKAISAPSVITDIPHLSTEEERSGISLLSGDLSTPAMGFYSQREKKGFLIMGHHRIQDRYTGFSMEENMGDGTMKFTIMAPGVRSPYKYFFGEKEDGTGFFPDAHAVSDDAGILAKEGDLWKIPFRIISFSGDTLNEFFIRFNRERCSLERGCLPNEVPFYAAYSAIKKKYQQENFVTEKGGGYYSVGTDRSIVPQCWQAGWVGGGMNNLPFLMEDDGEAYERGLSTFRFILDHLQTSKGWIVGMYADGVNYGDGFETVGSDSILFVRKNADLLYFLGKQWKVINRRGGDRPGDLNQIKMLADAFVRLYVRYGQLGQFIDMDTEEMLIGNTASPGLAAGGLGLIYEITGDEVYLKTAEALGEDYYEKYVKKGMLNGGPGEICQAPDSESAFGLLEAYVQLYETTRNPRWLKCAAEACEIAVTWVVSYDFAFPEESTAAKRKAHTLGTVFANAQNKHSAPGICTLSGNSLLKLYRFTGEERYLDYLQIISHSISQFVSLKERPVYTLASRFLPEGYVNERVQMSDWEGRETVGEFLYGSNWPEVTMLLTYVEVPGIYLNKNTGVIKCMDHVECTRLGDADGNICLELHNPTKYDAFVTILVDCGDKGEAITHDYYHKMHKVSVKAGAYKKEVLYR